MWIINSLGLYAMLLVPAIIVVVGIAFLVRRLSPVLRITLLVLSATLLLTPSWAPAIVTMPVPFGFLLVSVVISGAWAEHLRLVQLCPVWHAIAFPATALVAYVVVRHLLSNRRIETDALRSAHGASHSASHPER